MAPKSGYRGIARPSQGCGLLGSFPQLLKAVQKEKYRCVVHNKLLGQWPVVGRHVQWRAVSRMLALTRPQIQRSTFRLPKSKVHRRCALLVRGMRAVVQRVKEASVKVKQMLHQEVMSCMDKAAFTELTAWALHRLMDS